MKINDCNIMHNACFQVGQAVVEKDCKSRCVCQSSGLVKCENQSCASGEVCDVRDGVRGCHVKRGQCGISQVGLFSSFDGMSGAIQAQGAFEVASLCDVTSDLWFRVVVDVRVCSKGMPPSVATVYVFFKDNVVAMNSQHETWVRCLVKHYYVNVDFFSICTENHMLLHVTQVNGRKVSLPKKVTNELSVKASEKVVSIEKASAVQVTFSISQEVTIVIDGSLSGKVCGACGNYNGNSKDDMVTADGKITTDVSVVVGSWSAGDFSRW